jgi:hypothetical protein
MATNPLGIFSAALANGPHVEPFDVGKWMDQRALSQAQAGNLQADAGLHQQQAQETALGNQKAQRDLQLDQQRRQAAKDFSSSVPSAPPPSGFPAPQITGSDDEGNPIYDPNWHQAAAQASNPVPHFDWDGYSVKLLQMGDPDGAMTAAKTGREIRQKDAENAKKELETLQTKNSTAGQMLGGLLQTAQPNWAKGDLTTDPTGLATADAQYQQMKPQLEQLGVKVQDHFDPTWAAPAHAALIGQDKLIDQHNAILKGQSTEAETTEAKARTTEATARAEQTAEQTKMLKLSNDAAAEFVKNPAAVLGTGGMVDRLNLDTDAATRLKNQIYGLWQMPGTPKEKQTAVNSAIQKAVDESNTFDREKKLIPIRETAALNAAKARSEADNPALAGVPPALASKAVTDANKLDQDYVKAREATEAMGKLLDLADKGNTAAGANIPMVGVGAANAINGIKRINSAEIAQYGTAGSLLQKIQGKLEGWTEGQPIPASVRDDIRELHQQLGEGAYRQYTSGLASLNQRTGAKFQPTAEAPNIRKAPATYSMTATNPQGHKIGSNDNGKTWFDTQTGKPVK